MLKTCILWAMPIFKGTGNELNNVITGNSGDNVLKGMDGNHMLFGKDGNDKLYGGNGDDYLDGGNGNDYLDGGEGSDTYVFDLCDSRDIICDYAQHRQEPRCVAVWPGHQRLPIWASAAAAAIC